MEFVCRHWCRVRRFNRATRLIRSLDESAVTPSSQKNVDPSRAGSNDPSGPLAHHVHADASSRAKAPHRTVLDAGSFALKTPTRIRRIYEAYRRFAANQRGNISFTFAFSAVLLIGLAGAAIDMHNAVSVKQKLQDAADSAALAGAKVVMTPTIAVEAANRMLQVNTNSNYPIESILTPDSGSRRFTVEARQTVPTTVAQILGVEFLTVSVRAQAQQVQQGSPVCIHSLAPSISKGFEGSGGARVTAPQCTVWVNSTSSSAVVFSGGGSSVAQRHCFEGSATQGSFSPAPEKCGNRADPFASMNPSAPSACSHTNFSRGGGSFTVQPGVYCGGMKLSGGPNVTLSPGLYVIRNGPLSMSGGGTMTGNGITFLVEGSSAVNLSGGGNYRLTAQRSGELSGFVFFQRANSNVGGKAVISGSGDMYFEGVMYLPSQKAEVSGGGTTQTMYSPFTAYIANRFLYSGGSEIRVQYEPSRLTVTPPTGLFTNAGGARLVL